MKNSIRLTGILLLSIACLSSCHKTMTGTINCKDIATYTTTYGQLNSLQAELGDIYFIDQKNKRVGYIMQQKTDTSDFHVDPNVNNVVLDAEVDLSVKLDGNSPQLQLLSAKLEEVLEKNTHLHLGNPIRYRLKEPYDFLQRIDFGSSPIFEDLAQQDKLFMLVTSVVLADSLQLTVQNADTTAAGLTLVKSDGINFELSSNCAALIDVDGDAVGTFFKSIFFTYDPTQKRAMASTELFNFKGYIVNSVNQ